MTEQKTRGTWTWTERQEIVREYRQSGQNQRASCEQWGIDPSTLRNWCRRLTEGDQDDDPNGANFLWAQNSVGFRERPPFRVAFRPTDLGDGGF